MLQKPWAHSQLAVHGELTGRGFVLQAPLQHRPVAAPALHSVKSFTPTQLVTGTTGLEAPARAVLAVAVMTIGKTAAAASFLSRWRSGWRGVTGTDTTG